MDEVLRGALAREREDLGTGTGIAIEILADAQALTERFAEDLFAAYLAAKAAGRDKVVFIVPVGPIGQYQLWAKRCNALRQSLADLVLITMDEYLSDDARDHVAETDPLSFRGHLRRNFFERLDPALAPPASQWLVPHPRDLDAIPRAIAAHGGVDVCFGGVGITGHVAFNDPPESDEAIGDADFAALPTRVVRLSRETRLINAVTAARGNRDRIPLFAATVGMKEIRESRRIRLYMNREWQCAILRKALHGPVGAKVPVTLLRDHPDLAFVVTEAVARLPEPGLR